MKWQFWRRNSQPGEQVVSADTWHDTPETFPVEEVFRKSCFNWKRSGIVPLAILSLNVCILVKMDMILQAMSHVSDYLNPHFHPVSLMPYLYTSFVLDLLLVVPSINYKKTEMKRKQTQHDRVQHFANQHGTMAIASLLDLLSLRIKGGHTSSLTDTIIYNLKNLLSRVDTSSNIKLNEKQSDLLIGLLDQDDEYSNSLTRKQRIQFRYFSIMLAPSVMHVVGITGGEKAVNALLHKSEGTTSEKVRNYIRVKLNQHYSDYHYLLSDLDTKVAGGKVPSHNKQNPSSKRLYNYLLRFEIRRFPFLFLFPIPLMMYVLTDFMNYSPELSIHKLIIFMTGYLSFGIILTCMSVYFKVYHNSLSLRNAVQDHPDSISNFLSIESNSKSFYSQALILSSLLENTEVSQLEPLNRSQLNNLHRLLYPQKIYNSQISSFSHTPLPEIGVIPTILRGLVFLGDKSSVKVIEKLYNSTWNAEYRIVALECLDALNARLTEKPEQLLRASSLPGDALLRASQPSHTTEELLKPMVAEEHVVIPQTEEIDELEVIRQQL